MEKYIITKEEIAAMDGEEKMHFLNPKAIRTNKSLGDLTGLQGLGFHIIEIAPNHESTEYHQHKYEDECVFILEGKAEIMIGDDLEVVKEGDFIGYRASGLPHSMKNIGTSTLKCIVAGQRLAHDVADYPKKHKRLYRNQGKEWDLVDISDIQAPNKKVNS